MQQSPQPTLFWFLAPLSVDSLLIRSLILVMMMMMIVIAIVIDSAEVWLGNSSFMEDLFDFLKNDVF